MNEELDVDMDVDCMDGDDVCVSEKHQYYQLCVWADILCGWVT